MLCTHFHTCTNHREQEYTFKGQVKALRSLWKTILTFKQQPTDTLYTYVCKYMSKARDDTENKDDYTLSIGYVMPERAHTAKNEDLIDRIVDPIRRFDQWDDEKRVIMIGLVSEKLQDHCVQRCVQERWTWHWVTMKRLWNHFVREYKSNYVYIFWRYFLACFTMKRRLFTRYTVVYFFRLILGELHIVYAFGCAYYVKIF